MLLDASKEYTTRKGEPVAGLRFSHVHAGFNIFTGWTGGTARIWREDGRCLTEYHSPLHTLDHDIVETT